MSENVMVKFSKKLVCVYTHSSDLENAEFLISFLNKNLDISENNIRIIKVVAGHIKDEFVGDTLYLKCKESYDSLSVKTYEMIRMCTLYNDFDFLVKIDSSIVNYGVRNNVGYSKRVRTFYYALERIKDLLESETRFRLYKDYGGLHLVAGGNKEGYLKWAKSKNIQIDYDKIFGLNQPTQKYTGKLYYLSRNLCNEIINKGRSLAYDYAKHLGGSEDTLISKIYTDKNPNWQTEEKYKADVNKFINFRNQKKGGDLKSLYVVNHSLKYVWYVNPKVASRTLASYLDLNFPENYKEKKEDEIIETYNYLPYEKYYDYFKFMFVRNPYDRLLSTFLDKTKKVIGTPWEIKYFSQFKDYTFDQFVEYIYKNVNLKDNNTNRHIRTQISLANDSDDLNFIGKIENLQNDLKKLANILEFNVSEDVQIKNKTTHDHYDKSYTSETKQMVKEMYFDDFVRFGY